MDLLRNPATYNFGSVAVIVFGLVVIWAAKREPDPTKLTIHFAHWGKGTRFWEYRNVAKVLRGYVKNGNSIDHVIDYFSLGDPFPREAKYLLLKYSLGGVTRTVTMKEGEKLTISPTDTNLEFQITQKREWRARAERLQTEVNNLREEMAKRTPIPPVTRLLNAECAYLLDGYKRLDYDARDQVRLPLHNSSVPAFGQPWNYVHVRLHTLRDHFELVRGVCITLWKEMQWDSSFVKMFSITEASIMFDVIAAIEDLQSRLKTSLSRDSGWEAQS